MKVIEAVTGSRRIKISLLKVGLAIGGGTKGAATPPGLKWFPFGLQFTVVYSLVP